MFDPGFDRAQAVEQETDCEGNTLDLVIARSNCQPTDCTVQPTNIIICDHGLVTCRFMAASLAVKRNTVSARP